MAGAETDWVERHWRLVILLLWLSVAGLLVWQRWAAIHWFALGDTDDNLRMAQVRALIEGQGWFDLRQYRLAPPAGADIHWSRLVDLPIAGIKLLLAPLVGGADAERAAAAIAPLLPMGVALFALAILSRRMIAPAAFWLGPAILVCAVSVRAMWTPLRIDHHGWQLAILALAVTALTDPRRARGGILLGLATAASLAIGLEMLLYLAAAGAITVLLWVRDGEARRLAAYGASLAGGSALFFLLFASEANRAPVCDAFSPVWLSAMAVAGALAVALAFTTPGRPAVRLGAAALAGIAIAAAFALAWPHCLTGRLEQVPPELDELWLSRVKEAMPVYRHSLQILVAVVSLPVLGLIGYAAMLWRNRRDPDRFATWSAIAALAAIAALLLLWQTRAGPAAQLLAVPGAAALGWLLIQRFRRLESAALRIAGVALTFLFVSGLATFYAAQAVADEPSAARNAVNLANRRCPTLPALAPINRQPAGTVLTFVDLGPRLIAVTRHDALAGPYHRNHRAILDVMRAWRGDPADARRTVERYGVDYVLICPDFPESTLYRSAAPDGFYVQLARGEVPDWLEPIELPEGSPYRMWRVRR